MNGQDKERFFGTFETLLLLYPGRVNGNSDAKKLACIYFDELKDQSIDSVTNAALIHVRRSKRFPAISDLLRIMREPSMCKVKAPGSGCNVGNDGKYARVDHLLFELATKEGHVYTLRLNGMITGFPEGTYIINHAAPLFFAGIENSQGAPPVLPFPFAGIKNIPDPPVSGE